jgi:nucleotide-binding universal stress UspA family protein
MLDEDRATVAPIVVGTDGSESSDPALMMALQMTQRTGAAVHVVAIHVPMPMPVAEYGVLPALLEAEDGSREALRREVQSQVDRIAGTRHPGWSITVRDGDPATELAQIATEFDARVLIIGVKHRQLIDRMFGRETALRLLRLCRVPLLIVPAGFAHLPRRALIAIDFSAASFELGRTALRLLDTIADVTLLHVSPSPASSPYMYGTWREWFDEDTTRGFEWARSGLAFAPDVRVETATAVGNAPREIVTMARDKGVDLVVTGTRGAGLLDRLLVGSTARGVVHGAECAVLVIHTPAHMTVPYPILEPERQSIPRAEWVTALAEFSKRNAGRRTTLEVDDPQLGAQTQEQNYFLQGVAYDPNSRQVEIMVGDFEGAQRHLTRNISNVRSIYILPDASGKDWILRVAHGEGQTLLTLHR